MAQAPEAGGARPTCTAHRRATYAHQHSRAIVNKQGTVAVADLAVNRMVHNHPLAKSMHDAAWAQFAAHLSYETENAGRRYMAVNPADTSHDGSRCHHRQTTPRGERVYRCPCCHRGLTRDVNAARNIRAVGLHSSGARTSKPQG